MREIAKVFFPVLLFVFFYQLIMPDIKNSYSKNQRSTASTYCPYGSRDNRCIRPAFAENCLLPGERTDVAQNCCSQNSLNGFCVGSRIVPAENGVLCFYNSECRSQNCRGNYCHGSSLSLAIIGFSCLENQECASGNCDGYVCLGSRERPAKNGDFCRQSWECLSGKCFKNTCLAERESGKIGGLCQLGSDCESYFCSLSSFRCLGSAYKIARVGQYCENSVECESQSCLNNRCVGNRQEGRVGDFCQMSSDCRSGNCHRGMCLGSQYDYAKSGQVCVSHLECESGSCQQNRCQ